MILSYQLAQVKAAASSFDFSLKMNWNFFLKKETDNFNGNLSNFYTFCIDLGAVLCTTAITTLRDCL